MHEPAGGHLIITIPHFKAVMPFTGTVAHLIAILQLEDLIIGLLVQRKAHITGAFLTRVYKSAAFITFIVEEHETCASVARGQCFTIHDAGMLAFAVGIYIMGMGR